MKLVKVTLRPDRVRARRWARMAGRRVRGKAVYVYEWRWTRFAPNGEIVGASTEGYKRKRDCLANAKRAMTPCPIAS